MDHDEVSGFITAFLKVAIATLFVGALSASLIVCGIWAFPHSILAGFCFDTAGLLGIISGILALRRFALTIQLVINADRSLLLAQRHCQQLEQSLSNLCSACKGSGTVAVMSSTCASCTGSGIAAKTLAVWNIFKSKSVLSRRPEVV